MGFADAFSFQSAADIFREHAALSAFENGGRRDFDIGGLAGIGDGAFDVLDPVQWPLREGETRPGMRQDRRFFSNGGFYTVDGKARFVAPEIPAPKAPTSKEFPFRLNTGRVRDQWHTMTRSGMSARLGAHLPEPFVEVHPTDAKAMELVDGGFAKVTTRWGSCVLKVAVSDRQRRGSLFAPIHWSDETASAARVGDLVMPETDRYSGQPELQGDAGHDHTRALRLPGICLDAAAHRFAGRNLVGARGGGKRPRVAAGDERGARDLAERGAPDAR